MMTLRQFSQMPASIPTATSWYLSDLGEARGKQELFTKQSPQRLKALRESALIESAVSSNRIEGVVVEQSRVATIVFGKARTRDRDEAEVRGYRDALSLIHERGSRLPISDRTFRTLHRLAMAEVGDAGRYKKRDSDIIEKYPDGRVRVRFRTVAADQTASFMKEMVSLWDRCISERWVPPLAAMAALNLDFLCIHPFRDGNGRVSRLIMLLACYHLGYEAGRYISLERLIEETKDRYYETLEQSSQSWHEGNHDPWPYINYVLSTLRTAYRDLEKRVSQAGPARGEKEQIVLDALRRQQGEFRLADIERACPTVGREWIRRIMRQLRDEGRLECEGRGPAARWHLEGSLRRKKPGKGTNLK